MPLEMLVLFSNIMNLVVFGLYSYSIIENEELQFVFAELYFCNYPIG